jgi:hypothetical protein
MAFFNKNQMISTSLAWRCENLFAHHSSPSPSYPPHHCPFTLVGSGYGVGLFEDNYLFLLPAADLRMDPALRPRPVSSLTLVTLHNSGGVFYLHVEQFVFVFVFFSFLWPRAVGGSVKEGRIVCTIETK